VDARVIRTRLNVPQAEFLQLRHKFRGYVGGFGSGKTWAGCTGQVAHFWQFPKVPQGYFAPTFPHVRDIYYPTVEEVAHSMGMTTRVRTGVSEVDFYAGRNQYRGTAICRSLDRPERIVGFKIGHALVDELDVVKKDKAALAWRKVIARLRWKDEKTPGVRNGVDVTTTPEGFQFVHHQFVEQVAKRPELGDLYGLIHASTYENEANLPEDYIPSLLASYPGPLISAYIEGKFCNLTSGTVYPNYNRLACATNATIKPGEPLHIGMDFNVGKMAAVIHVVRNGRPMALDEICNAYDTPAMVDTIKNRYGEGGHTISVYPDASGKNRKTAGASSPTDHAILRGAGFQVVVDSRNPGVRDRVLAMNAAFTAGYHVNPWTCPTYAECLERQAYDKNGEPDKATGYDHPNDAGGYFIAKRFPITHNRAALIGLQGR
jgi:hypothetical protein